MEFEKPADVKMVNMAALAAKGGLRKVGFLPRKVRDNNGNEYELTSDGAVYKRGPKGSIKRIGKLDADNRFIPRADSQPMPAGLAAAQSDAVAELSKDAQSPPTSS